MNATKLWFLSLFLIVGIIAVRYFSDIILMFLIAGVVAFLLFRPVSFLKKKWKLKRRIVPTIVVFATVILLLIAALFLLIPMLYDQLAAVAGNISQYIRPLFNELDDLADFLLQRGFPEQLAEFITSISGHLESVVVNATGTAINFVLAQTLKLLDVVIFFCLTFYFMLDGGNLYRALVNLFPENGQIRIQRVAKELDFLIWNYLRQHIIISFGLFIVMWIGFMLFGLEYALLLAFLSFFLDFIPYIGSILAGVIATASAFLTGGWSLALGVLIFVICVQQIEGNIIIPKFQAKSVDVHPVAVIFSLLACNKLWGIFGMFISVPVAGLMKILFFEARDLYRSIDRPGGFGSHDVEHPYRSQLMDKEQRRKDRKRSKIRYSLKKNITNKGDNTDENLNQ